MKKANPANWLPFEAKRGKHYYMTKKKLGTTMTVQGSNPNELILSTSCFVPIPDPRAMTQINHFLLEIIHALRCKQTTPIRCHSKKEVNKL